MKCLLYDLQNNNDEELKNHCIYFHLINKDNYFFKELFSIDAENRYSRLCEECKFYFDTWRIKKSLFFIALQSGGLNSLPLNISKRSLITYYLVNYFLHKNDHVFYDAKKTVNYFIFFVENKFVSNCKVNFQGSMELINYQPAETDQIIELESTRTWLTDVYTCVFFNGYDQEEIKKIMKRVIINRMTGSSRHSKRFEYLS